MICSFLCVFVVEKSVEKKAAKEEKIKGIVGMCCDLIL